jgi:hypothetical protein
MDIFVHELRKIRMDRDFKGVWIPRQIWLSNDLTLQEKVFFVEINSLNNERGCYANNSYFADFFNLSKTRVSLVIKSLIDKGYISSEIVYKQGTKQIEKRVLRVSDPYLTKVKDPYLRNVKYPIYEKLKDNNTVNNTIINNKKTSKKGERFEQFWNTYGKKVDKKKAREQWMKLSEDDIKQLFYKLEGWLKSHPELKYRPHPMRWLRDRRWEDEIEQSKTSNGIKYL